MGNTKITCNNKIVNFDLNTNSSVVGGVSVTTFGRVGTLTGVLRYPGAGTSLMLAAMPDNLRQYAPSNQINLSCDFYSNGQGAEAFLNSDGQILVNQPVGGVDLKLSGVWIIKKAL